VAGGTGVFVRGKSIVVDFRCRGVRCRETLKIPPTPANLRYAKNMRGAILHDIAHNTFDYAKYFPSSKRVILFGSRVVRTTVREAMESYLTSMRRTLAASTMQEYESSLRAITDTLGDILITSLTTSDVRNFIGIQKCGNKRINNILVPLRGMLKDAHADGLIDRNPMDRIRNLPRTKHNPDPLPKEEINKILSVLPDQAADLICFAVWTGLRTGELLALQWDDIDWHRKTVRVCKNMIKGVVKDRPKTDSSFRDVDLLPPAIDALMAQKAYTFLADYRIFHTPNMNEPYISDQQIRRGFWKYALKKSGLRYRPPYQTRHTYASMMLSAGANPMWVAKQMGHADWGMIRKVYGKWIPQEVSEADRISEKMGLKSKQVATLRSQENTDDEKTYISHQKSGVDDGARTHNLRYHKPELYH